MLRVLARVRRPAASESRVDLEPQVWALLPRPRQLARLHQTSAVHAHAGCLLLAEAGPRALPAAHCRWPAIQRPTTGLATEALVGSCRALPAGLRDGRRAEGVRIELERRRCVPYERRRVGNGVDLRAGDKVSSAAGANLSAPDRHFVVHGAAVPVGVGQQHGGALPQPRRALPPTAIRF